MKEVKICIDQGNSRTKIGIFEGDDLLETKSFDKFTLRDIDQIFSRHPINATILSSVIHNNDLVVKKLNELSKKLIILSHETSLPIKNNYTSPETLGKDRLAAVVGAAWLKPNSDLLVIDAGTAITYDFINKNKVYIGGNIAPGINLRLRALHEFTGKLPLVEADENSPLLGYDTRTAISSGVLQGIIFEMNGYITHLNIKYPELSVFLTGGSTFYFDRKLKNTIFAEKNLVLIGLNRILQLNVKK
jgi:type III pantothenate kinase